MTQTNGQPPEPRWQPLQTRAARRTPRDGEGDAMLTKVANLLDDVTEGSRPLPPVGDARMAGPNTVPGPAPAPPAQPGVTAGQPVTSSAGSDSNQSDSEDGTEPLQSIPRSPNLPDMDEQGAIVIKGRSDGVSIELGAGDWFRLIGQLDSRLDQAANFFRGGQVVLNVGSRVLTEAELDHVHGVLRKYGLKLGMVRTDSERTFEAAMSLGLAVSYDSRDADQRLEAVAADSNLGLQSYFVFRGNLRSGQVLRKTEHIFIIGDINPGGQVISAGDVIVWGRLRGVAHAGSEGESKAIIAALQMEPTQLRIAGYIGVAPDQEREPDGSIRRRDSQKLAEVAYIADGQLVVRPWHDARRGFRSVLLP